MSRYLTEADAAIARLLAGTTVEELEGPTLDFKEDRATATAMEGKLADAAICFANAAGGTIIVGVADKGKGPAAITGTALEPDHIKRRIYELSRPHLNVEVARHPVHRTLLIISVPQSAEIHSDTQGRATRRINRDCLPMTPDEQARLREERRGIDWSSIPSAIGVADAAPEAVQAARAILSRFSDERRQLATASTKDLLSSIGALASRDRFNRAGALMFCRPDDEHGCPIVYQYRNTPGGEPKLVQRLDSPLVLAFQRTMDLVTARQSSTPVTMPNGQQITIEDFPSLVVREALSNAVCHRDYHLDSVITIEHSPDVFVVTSPGPLVSGVTTSNIITTTPRPRNPALANIARILGFAEELGRGVDRMYREMVRSGLKVPRIEAEYDRVRVALVGGAPDTRIARFVAALPEREREDTDTMLVLYRLCTAKTITATLAAPLLQKSPDEAEAILRRLAADDVALLEKTRGTAGRSSPTYRLREEALKGLGPAVLYNRRTTDEIDRKVIAHVREYGRITNRTLQNFLEMDVFKARDIITNLVSREILVRSSVQTRGPKVEWGPGPKFPAEAPKRSRKPKAPDPDQPG